MSTLAERIAAHESCTVRTCERQRAPDATVCKSHLNDLWAGRLLREPDGTYNVRRQFTARELSAA